jgi:peptidoglycan/xylan/chitin deacetylase (PgdA/CDA1 family)
VFSLKNNQAISNQLDTIFGLLRNKKDITPVNNLFAPLVQEKKYEIPIITYHYVEVVTNKDDFIRSRLSILPATFETQLKFLQTNNYQPIWIKEIPVIVSGTTVPDKKLIALTFDDGYGDFYTDVFPLLKKYNIKATLYVIPGFIDKPNYMTSIQLKEVIKNGLVEIGSHTVNHVDLPSVSEEVAIWQLTNSKEMLEKNYDIKIETFCYPYGFYNDKVIELVKKAGYKAAVSEVLGTTQSNTNLFYLSRVRAGGFYSVVK